MSFATITQLLLLGMIWGSSFLFQRITVPVLGVATTAVGRIVLAGRGTMPCWPTRRACSGARIGVTTCS
jgi:hypothetical protein